MFRALSFLLGTAVLGAVLAGIYYAPANEEARVNGWPAFNLAPGEVRQDSLQPTIPDSPISVQIEVVQGEVDIYVMNKDWAAGLSRDGALRLDEPFSFYRDLSATHVTAGHSFTVISDGTTWHTVIFDNSDNYYDGDAEPNGTSAELRVTVRYLDQEARSLVLGYIAVVPSVLLIGLTFGRQYLRWRGSRKRL